jgi:hypothetical protein
VLTAPQRLHSKTARTLFSPKKITHMTVHLSAHICKYSLKPPRIQRNTLRRRTVTRTDSSRKTLRVVKWALWPSTTTPATTQCIDDWRRNAAKCDARTGTFGVISVSQPVGY